MNLWALMRPQLEVTGLAVETVPVTPGSDCIKFLAAGVTLETSLVPSFTPFTA